jgi:hypothetical protein
VQDKAPTACRKCNSEGTTECQFCHGTGVMQLGDTLYCSNTGCSVCPVCNGMVRSALRMTLGCRYMLQICKYIRFGSAISSPCTAIVQPQSAVNVTRRWSRRDRWSASLVEAAGSGHGGWNQRRTTKLQRARLWWCTPCKR